MVKRGLHSRKKRVNGARALVTGGSSGMGLEYSRQLAAMGYDLVIVSNREEELAAAAAQLTGDGEVSGPESPAVTVTTHFQDLAEADSADALFRWYMDLFGEAPDVLVNNAGMFFFKEILPEDLPRVEAMLNLHITTTTRLTVLFGAEMKKRGSGRILNVSSMASRIPAPGITIYSATKAYLRNFGISYWFELRPYGVSLTTVCPAAIATPLYRLDPKLMRFGVRIGLIQTPRSLVRKALRAMFHGRRILSPGFMNIWLPPLVHILPAPLEAAIWKRLR